MKQAWMAAEEILTMLAPFGSRHLQVIAAGGGFPPNPRDLPPWGAERARLPIVTRGALAPGVDDQVLASIGRELRRALGEQALERRRVQQLVDALNGRGLSASTVRNTLNPLQVICRRAMHDGTISVDPTAGLLLPKSRGQRDRIVSPEYAQLLINALADDDRGLWAPAFYAGLRIGEIRALRWTDVDLAGSLLHVRRGWDEREGAQDPKSLAGERSVPIAEPLRRELASHGLRTGRGGDDLVFGRTATLPFIRSTVRARALTAWGWRQVANPAGGSPRLVGRRLTMTRSTRCRRTRHGTAQPPTSSPPA